ncbi:MAG: TerB family tellurite resistance protein [Mariniblastus sp.]|nr:TerB family tellurite resistance protein [Mariniblastus sp.]
MMPMEKVEVLRACCCVTGAGGTTTPEERELLDRLARQIGVGKASLEAMIARGETDPDFFREQFQVLKSNPEQTMTILIEAALSDGQLAAEESTMLREFAGKLEMPAEDFQSLIANVKPS